MESPVPPVFGYSWLCLCLACLLVLMLYVYKNVTSLRDRSCLSWFLVVSLMPIIVLAVPLLVLVVCWRGKVCVCVWGGNL